MKGRFALKKPNVDNTKSVIEILSIFQNVINEIESLLDYYCRSNNMLLSYKLDVEENYFSGKKLADIFDELFLIESANERNIKIEEIKKLQIDDKVTVEDVCEIIPFEKDNQNSISFSLKRQYLKNEKYDPKIAKQKYLHIEKYEYILVESILSHIIVSFESFLSNIYRLRLVVAPQKYLENQTIPLAAIFSDSINDTINDKLESEISSRMYESLSAIKWIADKEQISMAPYFELSNEFKEIYYRRNAYVHTKGKVNKDYLSKVDKSFTKGKVVDDDLLCDEEYLNNAICILGKIVFAVVFELLKKENADEDAIVIVANYYFEKLNKGEYQLAKYVYDKLSKYDRLSFSDKLMYKINYIIAIKQLDDMELVKKELEGLDVSATEYKFKIAKECLCENFEVVFNMLSESYPESFNAIAIKEWPIFMEFRNTAYFERFIELHKADFVIQQIEDVESEIDLYIEKEEFDDKE